MMHNPSELEVWLADGPDLEEIVVRFELLKAAVQEGDQRFSDLQDENQRLREALVRISSWTHPRQIINAKECVLEAHQIAEDALKEGG